MATSAPAARRFSFEDFELDIRAGELRKRGVKLRLQGQPLQILAMLLERSGEVVTREELRAEIWTADTFVDFDHSLHNAIARLREVLGDSADTPRYIETLPRRGYRFIAAVKRIEAEPQLPVSENGRDDEVPSAVRPTRVRAAMVIALLAFLAVGSTLWMVRKASQSGTEAGPRSALA